jgi:hypothetical protein
MKGIAHKPNSCWWINHCKWGKGVELDAVLNKDMALFHSNVASNVAEEEVMAATKVGQEEVMMRQKLDKTR